MDPPHRVASVALHDTVGRAATPSLAPFAMAGACSPAGGNEFAQATPFETLYS